MFNGCIIEWNAILLQFQHHFQVYTVPLHGQNYFHIFTFNTMYLLSTPSCLKRNTKQYPCLSTELSESSESHGSSAGGSWGGTRLQR